MNHIQNISNAISSIESQFHCNGTIPAASGSPVVITIKDKSKQKISFPMSINSAKEAFNKAPLEQSPFGHGDQTVVDNNVRTAMHLMPEKFDISWKPSDALLQSVQRALVPDSKQIRAELHKMNVYSQGGHFKTHKDTPRGPKNFGTLVVCLPVPHRGGMLSLSHGGTQVTHRWDGKIQPGWSTGLFSNGKWTPSDPNDPNNPNNTKMPYSSHMYYAAFFGDVDHSIAKVNEGYRVTLTYCLYRDDVPDPNQDVLLARTKEVDCAFRQALADKDFMTDGGMLGYNTGHLYEENALSKSEATLAGNDNIYMSKLKLKNKDAVVALVAKSAGVKVTCLRMMTGVYMDEDRVLDKMPTKTDMKKLGVVRNCDGMRAKSCDDDDIESFAAGTVADVLGAEPVDWIGKRTEKAVAERQYSAEGYFGNEASAMDFYTHAALILHFKPYEERIKDLAPFKEENPATAKLLYGPKGKKPAVKAAKAAKASSSSSSSSVGEKRKSPSDSASAAGAPPQVFKKAKKETKKELTKQLLNTYRTVNVINGHTHTKKAQKLEGKCTLTLGPNMGMRDLKKGVQKMFGRYPHHAMSSMMLVVDGKVTSKVAKSEDLLDGATVACTYRIATGPGNLRALNGGGRRVGYRYHGGGGDECVVM